MTDVLGAIAALALYADLPGRYGALVGAISLWLIAVTRCRSRSEPGFSLILLLAATVVGSWAVAGGGIAARVAFLPAIVVFAWGASPSMRATIAMILLLSSSLAMATTLLVEHYLVASAPVAAGLAGSVVVLAVLVAAFRQSLRHLGWYVAALAGLAVGSLSGLGDPGQIGLALTGAIAIQLVAATPGRAVTRLASIGWLVLIALWWLPYRNTLGPEHSGRIAVLLPAAGALAETPFSESERMIRQRFPNFAIWHTLDEWVARSTLIIPYPFYRDYDPAFWADVVSRAESNGSRLVVYGEHTNFAGFVSVAEPLWSAYGIRFADDTTVPRPNRDLLGEVWSVGLNSWRPDLALNRGASIRIERLTARPVLVGRDWFADSAGWRFEKARLGDLKPDDGARKADVLLAAHGLSRTRQSVLTLVADGSMWIARNAALQPIVTLQSATGAPLDAFAWDLLVTVLLLLLTVPAPRFVVASNSALLAVSLTPLLLMFADTNATREHDFISERDAPLVGYNPRSSADFRIDARELLSPAAPSKIVLGTWADLATSCGQIPEHSDVFFFGVPALGDACGVQVAAVFRFGSLNIPHGSDVIGVQDGSWARLVPQDVNDFRVLVGTADETFAATWTWKGKRIRAIFDRQPMKGRALAGRGYQALVDALSDAAESREAAMER